MPFLAQQLIQFYNTLKVPEGLPPEVEVLNPQKDPTVTNLVETFFNKFFADNERRHLLFGINPGRFGGGTTGINFTGPRQLTQFCQIENSLKQQSALSAEFIYEVIQRFGGCESFYKHFFITAISPLGYTRNGINMNYYDDKKLQSVLEPFIIENIQRQLAMGFYNDACICIGGEKNFKFFSSLNDRHHFFDEIIPLPHPRFILQYRRPKKEEYVLQYLSTLQLLVEKEP